MPGRRITGLLAVGFLTLAAVVVAQPPADPDLRTRQQQNADRFRRLKEKLLALAQRLDASDDPAEKRRAKVIVAALDLAARENIDGQFKTLVGEVAKGGENVQDMQRMVAQDAQLSKAIQDMLAVLMTDDEQARLKAEIARLEEALKEAREIRRTQEAIRALTDAQKGDPSDIARNQRDLAERTKDLADRMTGPKNGGEQSGKKTDDKKSGDPKEGKDGKSGDPSGPRSKDGKGGDPKDAKSKDGGKVGDKAKDGKSGEQSKDGKAGEGKDKTGDRSGKETGKGTDGKSGDQSKDGKASESKDGKSGEKSEGSESKDASDRKGKEGQKSDGKSPDGLPKGKKDGQHPPMGGEQRQPDQQQAPQPRPKDQQQQPEQLPGRKYIQEAYPHQKAAEKDLEKKDRANAGKNADQAIDELSKAIQELEKRLKQLREQEAVKLLAGLEARCARMLEMQRKVYAATQEIDAAVRNSGQKSTADIQKAQQQSDEERKIVTEADTALKLIQSEGSAVAFGRVLEEVREDMIAVERRLGSATVDADTQQIEQNIIAMLDEMTKALAKQKQDMQQQQQQQQQQQNRNNGPPPNRELVNLLAELKLIRTLQTQVNDRTKMYGAKSPGEQAADPNVQAELRQLAVRQAKVQEMLNAIATGANK